MAYRLTFPGSILRALVLAAVVLTAASGVAHARSRSRSSRPTKDCKKDMSCVLVPVECCGCNAGGAVKAIPARDKAADQKARAARCGGTVCVQVMSTDPSCSAQAVCRAGTCMMSTDPRPRSGKHHRRGHR